MSTIPAVLAALTSLATSWVGTDWLVINGPVGSVTTTKGNLVIVGDADVVGSRALDSLTLGTSEERYTVPVTVAAFIPGSDQQAADTLALDVYTALEVAIREYPGGPTLGLGGVLKALPTGAFTLKRTADGDTRYAAVSFVVDVWAQTT